VASEQDLNRVASEIIGAGMAIHRQFGPGCFESLYVPCLAYELEKRSLRFISRVALPLRYYDLFIPRAYEADFVVEEEIVIEVKALEVIAAVHLRETFLEFSAPLRLCVRPSLNSPRLCAST
jgi:GxxExxY protein